MRTARALTVSPWSRGGGMVRGGAWSRGVVPQHALRQTPLWTEWQTGVKILPCTKLRLRVVIGQPFAEPPSFFLLVITACQRSCGKVMFSVESVHPSDILSIEGPMWALSMMHWTSPYRDPSWSWPPRQGAFHSPSSRTWDLAVQGPPAGDN